MLYKFPYKLASFKEGNTFSEFRPLVNL